MVDLEKQYLDLDVAILIADDQKFMLKNLERYFKKYFNVTTASTFEQAKDILNSTPIGVAVSDHQMVDGQGIMLLEYIRDNFADTRGILITADRHEQVVIDMMDAKLAQSFVFKPTDKGKLHQAIAEQMEIYLKN